MTCAAVLGIICHVSQEPPGGLVEALGGVIGDLNGCL